MDNSTLKAILSRRSIRSFTPEALTSAELNTLAEVALASPSGMNVQPWQFQFVVNTEISKQVSAFAFDTFREQGNDAVIERMKTRHESIFYGAPLVVFISVPKSNPSAMDAGIAAENLAIAAQAMGLGSCIIGLAGAAFAGSKAQQCREMIQMPSDHEFSISVAIGHPAIGKEAHEMHPEKITWVR